MPCATLPNGPAEGFPDLYLSKNSISLDWACKMLQCKGGMNLAWLIHRDWLIPIRCSGVVDQCWSVVDQCCFAHGVHVISMPKCPRAGRDSDLYCCDGDPAKGAPPNVLLTNLWARVFPSSHFRVSRGSDGSACENTSSVRSQRSVVLPVRVVKDCLTGSVPL